MQLENDKKKSYQTVIRLKNDKLIQIANKDFPNAILGDEGNANYALVSTTRPYLLESQWTGMRARNYEVVNINTGEHNKILTKVPGFVRLSPKGKYVYGYNPVDSTWFAHNITTNTYKALTKGKLFYNELNDSPRHPNSYGVAGWTNKDESIVLYDRYDLWEFNPVTGSSVRLTKGREDKTIYRYIQLDDEERTIDSNKKWVLSSFNETTKDAGYF